MRSSGSAPGTVGGERDTVPDIVPTSAGVSTGTRVGV